MRPDLCVALAVVATTSAATGAPQAARPSVADCLSATESSLELEKEQKLQAARVELLVCSARSCPADIRAECSHRIDAVNAAVPTVVFSAKDGGGRGLTQVRITMDGAVVASQLDGTALSFDPGLHHFTFEVPNQAPVSEDLVLHAGEKNRAESVMIGTPVAAPVATAPVTPIAVARGAAPAAPAALASAAVTHDTVDRGHGRRVAGAVVGVAGVAGVALGSVFGGLTISTWNQADKACPSHFGCSPSAIRKGRDATTDGNVSTASLIAGGVLAVTGITIFFAAPRAEAPSVGLRIGPSGLGVEAMF